MKRRDAVRDIGLLLGVAVTPCVARAVRAGVRAPPAGQGPRALAPRQAELVATLAEMIIPTTDTPGARAARVHAFIDALVADIFTASERDAFLAGLDDVDARARAGGGVGFLESPAGRRLEVMAALEREARSAGGEPRPFFAWLKELTLVGYYTSEIGASRELRYVHVAGRYDGDVPYAQVGRAYS